MDDINLIIDQAKGLGIAITDADLNSEICQAWVDRVALAAKYFREGNMADCQAAIDDANSYVI